MLTTNKRKNVNKEKKRLLRRGVWFQQDKWSGTTSFLKDRSDGDNRYCDNMDPALKPLATGLANFYGGEWSQRVGVLAQTLFEDVFHNPEGVLEMALANNNIAAKYSHDLFEVMRAVGYSNIFVDSGNVKESVLEEAQPLGGDLYLTDRRMGMPVWAFMLYYKGSHIGKVPIAEWSGIPVFMVDWAYLMVTQFLWQALGGLHQQELISKIGQRPQPQKRQEVEDYDIPPWVNSAHEREPWRDPNYVITADLGATEAPEESTTEDEGEAEPTAAEQPKFDQVEFVPDDVVPAEFPESTL